MSDPQPLVLLSKAERMLAEAVDLTEMMDLRATAKAAEAAAVALGLADIAQQAKVFQLRAERKAGAWLTGHTFTGRPPETCPDGRVRLADLDIDYHESSRWQALALIPDDKFHAYLDEHLARGWEVTAGGLRAYGRNLNGHEPLPRRTGSVFLIPPPGVCALHGYRVQCVGPLTGQHILNKSKARGNEEVRAILALCPDELMAQVCTSHNVDRWADQRDAQRILLLQKVYTYGLDHMANFLGSLPWKVPHPELTLEGILG